jgi:hypothetical protein
VLSDVGQNESKIKRNKFPAGLDKVVGFIEAQGHYLSKSINSSESNAVERTNSAT